MSDRDGRIPMSIDGKRVRRVAPHLRQRTYSRGAPYERALKHTLVTSDGCWVWTGARTPSGYGHMNVGGGRYRHVHIVTYEHHHGPVPAGLVLDHLCRNRACVNPDHVEPVTQAENVHRGNAMKRKCDHAEHEFYRRKSNGRIVYCRACRRERRRQQREAKRQ